MIREGRKLPPLVNDRIPVIIEEVSKDSEVVALFSFGSLARGDLKPLSDLDFAVLVSRSLDPRARFEKHLHLIGLFNQVFKTDEIDLVLLNDVSIGFSFNIIFSGRLLYCGNRAEKESAIMDDRMKEHWHHRPRSLREVGHGKVPQPISPSVLGNKPRTNIRNRSEQAGRFQAV